MDIVTFPGKMQHTHVHTQTYMYTRHPHTRTHTYTCIHPEREPITDQNNDFTQSKLVNQWVLLGLLTGIGMSQNPPSSAAVHAFRYCSEEALQSMVLARLLKNGAGDLNRLWNHCLSGLWEWLHFHELYVRMTNFAIYKIFLNILNVGNVNIKAYFVTFMISPDTLQCSSVEPAFEFEICRKFYPV